MRGNFRLDKASWFLESGFGLEDDDDAAVLAGSATVAVVVFAEKSADLLILALMLPLIAFRENKERDDAGRMRLWPFVLWMEGMENPLQMEIVQQTTITKNKFGAIIVYRFSLVELCIEGLKE